MYLCGTFIKKVRRGADSSKTRMQVLHERIGGRLPFIGVVNLYTADQMIQAYETDWADFLALGKTVMLNPNLVQLIEEDREEEIETVFDWEHYKKYRYTDVMLEGTYQGLDFYPPSNLYQKRSLNDSREEADEGE